MGSLIFVFCLALPASCPKFQSWFPCFHDWCSPGIFFSSYFSLLISAYLVPSNHFDLSYTRPVVRASLSAVSSLHSFTYVGVCLALLELDHLSAVSLVNVEEIGTSADLSCFNWVWLDQEQSHPEQSHPDCLSGQETGLDVEGTLILAKQVPSFFYLV